MSNPFEAESRGRAMAPAAEGGSSPRKLRRGKSRKRDILLALGVGALAAVAATGILSDGFGGPGSSFKDDAQAASADSPEPR